MQTLEPAVAGVLRDSVALAARGDPAAARATAEAALRRLGSHGAIHAFLGMICCREGDVAAGIPHLRAALRLAPDDMTIAANLAAALIQAGAIDEAATICTEARAARDTSCRLWRLRGYVLQQRGAHADAARAYEHVVAHAPGDAESWNNLGNALASAGRPAEAVLAIERAADLHPDSGPIRLNLAAALTQSGRLEDAVATLRTHADRHPDDPKPLIKLAALLRHLSRDAEALEALERAVAASPRDAELRVQLGRERMALLRLPEAEQAFRDALAISPANADAHIGLALLLEHMNRAAELPDLLGAAERGGVDAGAIRFIRLLICRREGRFADGLALLRDMPEAIEPIHCAALEGQFRDRLGDADGAMHAFAEMNRRLGLDPSHPRQRGEAYRARLRDERARVTPQWHASWRPVDLPSDRPAPAFLVGFPRSGTTLLDTMLMGHPKVRVMEEKPPLQIVERHSGGLERLPDLDAGRIAALRQLYFEEVAKCVDVPTGALLVDKAPLHMNKVPLIHRLFPEARFILALRHPCDVVLSCYSTAFRLNDAMASFLDLETTAEFYDLSFGHWRNCAAIMPLIVHEVRYERVVADPEPELRRLLGFLGLDWDPATVDHRRTAQARGPITTASYAQVTETLYRRASGRWQRYCSYLEPVLPILKPWIEAFSY